MENTQVFYTIIMTTSFQYTGKYTALFIPKVGVCANKNFQNCYR